MLLVLIRKEIIGHVLTLRFAVIFLLMLVLVFAAFFLSAGAYRRHRDDYSAMSKASWTALDAILDEQNDRRLMYRLFFWEGKSDPVPAAELSSIAVGLTDALPDGVTITARGLTNIDASGARNPMLGMYQAPDLVYVVGVALSLLALLFIYDGVCGEKESGLLRLVLSNAAPRHHVLLSKWFGGYLVLIVPFLMASLGGLGYAWALGALELTPDHLQRIGLLLLLAMLYISVFFTLGLFVSTLTHRAATSLFICMFLWVAWVLAVPSVAPVAAKLIAPAPSPQKIVAEKTAIDTEIRLRKGRLTLITGELNYGQKIRHERERLNRAGRERKNRLDRYLRDRQRIQTQWAELLGRLSPAGCWVYAATALTQTGPAAYRRFEEARRRLHAQFLESKKPFDVMWRKERKVPRPRADELPTLAVFYPDLGESMEDALFDVLILALLSMLLFMAAFMSFLRYDVR